MGIRHNTNIKILRKTTGSGVSATTSQPVVIAVDAVPRTLEKKYMDMFANMKNTLHPTDLLLISQNVVAGQNNHLLNWEKFGKRLDISTTSRPDLGLTVDLASYYQGDFDRFKKALENFIDSRGDGKKDIFSRIHWVETGCDLAGNKFMDVALSVVQEGNSRGATARQLHRFLIANDGKVIYNLRQTNGRNKKSEISYLRTTTKNLKEGIGTPGNEKKDFLDAFLRTLVWTNGNVKLNFPDHASFKGNYVSPMAKIKVNY